MRFRVSISSHETPMTHWPRCVSEQGGWAALGTHSPEVKADDDFLCDYHAVRTPTSTEMHCKRYYQTIASPISSKHGCFERPKSQKAIQIRRCEKQPRLLRICLCSRAICEVYDPRCETSHPGAGNLTSKPATCRSM